MKNTLYKIDKKLEKITNIKFLIVVIILILVIIIFAMPQDQKDQTSNKTQQDQINIHDEAHQECKEYLAQESFHKRVFDYRQEEYDNCLEKSKINNKVQQECQEYEEKLKKSFRMVVFDRSKEEYNNCLEYWNWFYSDKQGEKI